MSGTVVPMPTPLVARIESAWRAAFRRSPASCVAVNGGVHVDGLAIYPLDAAGEWGVGSLVDIAPDAPGEPVGVGVLPRSEHPTVEAAIFALLSVAALAEEARRAMAGEPSLIEEWLRPF